MSPESTGRGWSVERRVQELDRVERVYAPVSFVESGVGGDPHQPLIRIETRKGLLGASRVPGPVQARSGPQNLLGTFSAGWARRFRPAARDGEPVAVYDQLTVQLRRMG